ncbi:MAG: polysaccharide biosynthesis/export family protein [Ferruginibacter sp.]
MYRSTLVPLNNNLVTSLTLALLLLVGSSCRVTKPSHYFETLTKDTTISGFVTNDFESKIRKGDMLTINVTSLSIEEDVMFNKGAAAAGTAAGYLVRPDGTVLLHRLGYVPVEGLTRKELAQKLQKDLLAYMKEPIVNVGYLNHKVTVIGEVGKPGIVEMPEEQMPLLDVLVLSGDIQPNAKRNRVMIIRDKGTEKQVKYVNLQDHSLFTSAWYYSQPNDIIYVLADTEKEAKEAKKVNIQTTMALVASGLSFIFIVIDRLTR